jgi:CheY-like chemotaxis protein
VDVAKDKMLRRALILSSQRDYAQAMRQGLLKLAVEPSQIDVELDAVRALQLGAQNYELIVLDSVLDAMDGLQVLQLLKGQAPAAKFIIVSDAGDETSRALAYQNGADFFIQRPHTTETFELAWQAIRGMFKGGTAEPPGQAEDDLPVSLADIVQMRCLSGDSVLLLVRSEHLSGDVFIFRGEVFHAQYPGKGGEAALHDMLHWDNGRVRVKSIRLTHVPPRTIEIPYQRLVGSVEKTGALRAGADPIGGELYAVAGGPPPDTATLSVIQEAPPRADAPPQTLDPKSVIGLETPLPHVNSHWQVNLSGELLEGSQVVDPDRCAFITTFIYRKLADVAVTLEVDYFEEMTLLGPHLQQVLVADNISVRHGVFDTAWTTEDQRVQYVKWCREQSF